uniref:Uncharacterized protein n=1 Tax=Glossina palpalis gambiensis TaxID=67801 RepID=A0A1B0BJW5_9MUSC
MSLKFVTIKKERLMDYTLNEMMIPMVYTDYIILKTVGVELMLSQYELQALCCAVILIMLFIVLKSCFEFEFYGLWRLLKLIKLW